MRSWRRKWPAAGLGIAFVAGLVAGSALRPPQALSVERPRAESPVPAGGNAAPRDEPASSAGPAYPADVLRVIDGDTFEARVHVWPGLEITTKVRLREIDAPEMRARCADERARAESARAALITLLAQGDVRIRTVGLDKYGGRVLAEAATQRTDNVSQAMLAAGHARRYAGGRREGWCG